MIDTWENDSYTIRVAVDELLERETSESTEGVIALEILGQYGPLPYAMVEIRLDLRTQTKARVSVEDLGDGSHWRGSLIGATPGLGAEFTVRRGLEEPILSALILGLNAGASAVLPDHLAVVVVGAAFNEVGSSEVDFGAIGYAVVHLAALVRGAGRRIGAPELRSAVGSYRRFYDCVRGSFERPVSDVLTGR